MLKQLILVLSIMVMETTARSRCKLASDCACEPFETTCKDYGKGSGWCKTPTECNILVYLIDIYNKRYLTTIYKYQNNNINKMS